MENTNNAGGGEKAANPTGVNTAGGAGSTGSTGAVNPNSPSLSNPGGATSVLELTDDSMVKLPGAKEPVRYGDHYRSFQSEFTKRAQAASAAQQKIAQLTNQLKEVQARQTQAQTQQNQPPNTQQKMAEFANGLKSLTYLSGEDAARVVDQLTQQFAGYEQSLSQRDLALSLLYKKLMQVDGQVSGFTTQRSKTEFDSKITNFVKQGGLPEKAVNWAKELYLAYEGDDLDREFPRIMKERWEELKGLYEGDRKAAAENARRLPFVPGKGGNGTPSRPLQNLSRASAKDIANAMWPGVDGDVET